MDLSTDRTPGRTPGRTPDRTTGRTAPDAPIPLVGRLLLVALGALAVALGGAGVAFASSVESPEGDSAWVVVEDHDEAASTSSASDCPWRTSPAGDGL